MQKIDSLIIENCEKLFNENKIDYVLGYIEKDKLEVAPKLFDKNNFKKMCFNHFCNENLSKILYNLKLNDKRVAIVCKPCDSYSLNLLIKENRLNRENIFVIGVECNGHLDIKKIEKFINDSIIDLSVEENLVHITSLYKKVDLKLDNCLSQKCLLCKSKEFALSDLEIVPNGMKNVDISQRFKSVEFVEKMSTEEKFKFWNEQLSKCIRCNGCKNVCPCCYCEKCIFDNNSTTLDSKISATPSEEKLYHIIRAYHVAGRCTDCNECVRVCPQNIPLHLINRKIIKDINENFGEFQSGKDSFSKNPLTDYSLNDKD